MEGTLEHHQAEALQEADPWGKLEHGWNKLGAARLRRLWVTRAHLQRLLLPRYSVTCLAFVTSGCGCWGSDALHEGGYVKPQRAAFPPARLYNVRGAPTATSKGGSLLYG